MGEIREATTCSENSNILLDDICEKIIIKKVDPLGCVYDFDVFSYDFYDRIARNGRRGARVGRCLKADI